MILPSLFVSHGAPSLVLEASSARDFLVGLASAMPRPEAIVVVSAHWRTAGHRVGSARQSETIHDYYGFPKALYPLSYRPPGAPCLAARVAGMLEDAGLQAALDPGQGLDHGVWQPLLLTWPEADIPVLPVSLDAGGGPARHLALGRALAPLRRQGVLVVGSGGLTHNLAQWQRARPNDPQPQWVRRFAEWVARRLAAGDHGALVHYRERAPEATRNHPTEEHFLPLLVALGAAGAHPRVRRLHTGVQHGVLRMDAYRFDSATAPGEEPG